MTGVFICYVHVGGYRYGHGSGFGVWVDGFIDGCIDADGLIEWIDRMD